MFHTCTAMQSLNTPGAETLLIAGPPGASPPLLVALLLVALSIVAPFLFLRAGAPSLLFGIAVLALAAAGIITLIAAISAQLRRRADAAMRPRARINAGGITLQAKPDNNSSLHFTAAQIASARLHGGTLVIQTIKSHPKPGRYVLRYGKLVTPRDALIAALTQFCVNDAFKP